jgi:ATP-binding cassette subfamily F protein 3
VLVVSHDRYFLNQVVDRLIVVADGRARVIDGDYATYQYIAKQEAEALLKTTSGGTGARASSSGEKPRRKRKFPYRKPADLECEISQVEAELAAAEAALADPETWKDAGSAKAAQSRYDTLKEHLPRLYEHWEEAVELNS